MLEIQLVRVHLRARLYLRCLVISQLQVGQSLVDTLGYHLELALSFIILTRVIHIVSNIQRYVEVGDGVPEIQLHLSQKVGSRSWVLAIFLSGPKLWDTETEHPV